MPPMQITEAAAMLRCPLLEQYGAPVRWADLGCGSGVFTRALAMLLPPGSSIYAVDRAASWSDPGDLPVTIHFLLEDFETASLDLPPLDGILMANALHYVRRQDAFLARIRQHLAPDGAFLMVEYDTDKPVQTWVPYPISFASLSKLFRGQGFARISKLQERPSVYRSGKLYSALLQH